MNDREKFTRKVFATRSRSRSLIGKKTPACVFLAGWVFRHRDQGGCIFVDLRDSDGIIQLVFDRKNLGELFLLAEQVRSEYVLYVQGQLQNRSAENINPNLPDGIGSIEVVVENFVVGGESKVPPISVAPHDHINEEKRLQYRFLDLRRDEMQRNLRQRSRFNQTLRNYLIDRDFVEIETPILSKPTPEGARDFLVPCRPQQSESLFYALPQSPQLLKQILMVSGYERYFQIARCFRDEDLRADRQPEFTQLDMEMSFVNEELIMQMVEKLWADVLGTFCSVKIATPWPRMTHAQALRQTGTDKPDFRFGLEIIDISELVRDCEFAVFRNVVAGAGKIKAGRVQGICFSRSSQVSRGKAGKSPAESMSRKVIDEITRRLVEQTGIQGLAWFRHDEKGLQSNISKFFTFDVLAKIAKKMKSETGDVLFFVAGQEELVQEALGVLRNLLAHQFSLIPDAGLHSDSAWNLVWVTEFPLFRVNEASQLEGAHHPFASPSTQCSDLFGKEFSKQKITKILRENPSSLTSRSYDLILNGVEIGGGSMRNHDVQVQRNILTCLGLDRKTQQEQFGFLLDALEYGAPVHGGIAFGLDRLLMLILGKNSIREVIAFPKTQKGQCLFTGAPGCASADQLKELGLLRDQKKKQNPSKSTPQKK